MKRRLLIIAIFLLVGAVVNVAVAWGCAAFVPGVPGKREWLSRVDPRALDLAASGDPDIVGVWEYSAYGYDSLVVFGYWDTNPGGTGTTILDYHSARAGLPLRCFVGRHQFASADQVDGYVGAWPVPWRVSPLKISAATLRRVGEHRLYILRQHGGLRFLPLHAIWPGFAANTLLYATLLWLLIPGPFALRRFLRLRRGLCPKCAYPIGESSVCTECGRALPTKGDNP